ncbi:F-box protein SKIP28-like [Typha latifolia]|uniref:F-box protein SKIP28-like n=1 Tax=Typha latifolia TaxID=4733 RepID=UPI003C2F1F83
MSRITGPDPSPAPTCESLHGSSSNSLLQPSSTPSSEQTDPHAALFLVLGYLRLREVLAFQSVCKLFRDAIADDCLLWQHITVEPPLSSKLTDDTLLRISSRAEGKLKSLALFHCCRITDASLLQVVDRNPGITKLYVPGCTYLTADGMVKVVKQLNERKGNLNSLRLHGLCNITKDHLDILNSFLCKNNWQQVPQPSLYSYRHCVSFDRDDGRPIDVDLCPRCRNVRLVFDCTRQDCRTMKYRWTECRGCFFCIARCEGCGGCIDFEEPGEETACSHLLCLQCWLQLPKCNTCNRPYCKGHASFLGVSTQSAGFVCQQCEEFEVSSFTPATDN